MTDKKKKENPRLVYSFADTTSFGGEEEAQSYEAPARSSDTDNSNIPEHITQFGEAQSYSINELEKSRDKTLKKAIEEQKNNFEPH